MVFRHNPVSDFDFLSTSGLKYAHAVREWAAIVDTQMHRNFVQ